MDKIVKKLMYGPLSPIAVWAFRFISDTEYLYFNSKWQRAGESVKFSVSMGKILL